MPKKSNYTIETKTEDRKGLTKINFKDRTISFYTNYGDGPSDPHSWETYSIDDLPQYKSNQGALDPRDEENPFEIFVQSEGNDDVIIIETKVVNDE